MSESLKPERRNEADERAATIEVAGQLLRTDRPPRKTRRKTKRLKRSAKG